MDILRKHKNSIEFVLLFIPTAWVITSMWNGDQILKQIFDFNIYLKASFIPTGLGKDLHHLIGIYGPFILWKIFTKYWIK
tara:strand:- start:882 stop:1121 length:240 start_codon:yes stop_codon:yes gene_type:complete